MTPQTSYTRYGFIIALIAFLADQLHKTYMLHVVEIAKPIEVLPFFNLVMVWNPGISFGMFQGHEASRIIFSVLAIVICTILWHWLRRTPLKLEACAIGLIIGGAIGNVVDRVLYGAVADFFDIHVAGYHWPAFNIADSCVCVGAVLLIYTSLAYGNNQAPDANSSKD